MNKKMVQESEKDFWRKYIKVYDQLNRAYPYKDLINNIIDELDVHSGDDILDAGGGTGNVALQIIKRGGSVTLLDNSEEAINYFLEKVKAGKVIIRYLRGSLPFADDSFDKIVCNNTLYIIESKFYDAIIKEFWRILKKGGMIVLSNPIKSASPYKILLNHFKMVAKKNNTLFLMKELFVKLNYLVLLLYYNHRIKNKSRNKYHFFEIREQEEVLKRNNFNIKKTVMVYANQNILTVGIKK